MLVAQGGLGRRVPEAVHDLLDAGAGGGRERGRDVAEVMEVEVGETDAPTSEIPLVLPDRVSQRPTLGTREDPGIGGWIGPPVEV